MRLIKEVDLILFEDDATGDWGITHKNTYNEENSFNAGWNATIFFHDVLEHAHEHSRYFSGHYSMNVGGEMTAMGSMWYFHDEMGFYMNRRLNSILYFPGDQMRRTTESKVQESIYYGYTHYGNTLESNVPHQSPIDNGELEYQIKQFWTNVKGFQYQNKDRDLEYGYSTEYKNSVTFRKIADLHRYGYRIAERMIPNNWHNRNELNNFWEFCDELCKLYTAEYLKYYLRGFKIKIYKNCENIIWRFWCKTHEGKYFKINDPHSIENKLYEFSEIEY